MEDGRVFEIAGYGGQIVVDMAYVYELLRQCDTLRRVVIGETVRQSEARNARLKRTQREIKAILPGYKIVWYARYRAYGLVPDTVERNQDEQEK